MDDDDDSKEAWSSSSCVIVARENVAVGGALDEMWTKGIGIERGEGVFDVVVEAEVSSPAFGSIKSISAVSSDPLAVTLLAQLTLLAHLEETLGVTEDSVSSVMSPGVALSPPAAI